MDDKNCILLYHLGTGDGFTMYAAVIHYQKLYKEVNIFVLHRNMHTFTQLYQPYDNVKINIIHDIDVITPCNKLIQTYESQSKQVDLLCCGNYHGYFEGSNGFWERFYEHLHLQYNIRYDCMDINRNKEREITLYNAVVSKYGKNYIFLHDHRNIKSDGCYARPNIYVESDLPVFHPNFNYYTDSEKHTYHDLWTSDFISDNLLDYCTLIENATEIHIRDSSFSCLAPYLDLTNVKKKCVYTDYDMVGYHNSYGNWEIIK